MESQSRLSTIDASLTRRIEHATPGEHFKVICIACTFAQRNLPLVDHAIVEAAMSTMLGKRTFDSNDIGKLKMLANKYDEEYLELQSTDEADSEWMKNFSMARLLSALAMAFENDLERGSDEIVYEISACFDDPELLLQVVRANLA